MNAPKIIPAEPCERHDGRGEIVVKDDRHSLVLTTCEDCSRILAWSIVELAA